VSPATTLAAVVYVLATNFCILIKFNQMEPAHSDNWFSVVCRRISTWAPGIFATYVRPEFVAIAVKLAAFQNPLASWLIRNGGSNDNVVLCSISYWLLS